MPDSRRNYDVTIYFTADNDDHAEDLFDKMLDGIGCTNDPDHVCPHFLFAGGPYEIPETRKAALRRCKNEIWYALRVLCGRE